MAGVRRNLWKWSRLLGWRFHSLLSKLLLCLTILTVTKRYVYMEYPVIQFMCTVSSSAIGHHQEKSHPHHQVWAESQDFPSPSWVTPASSVSACMPDAPVPSSSQWPFAGRSPICPHWTPLYIFQILFVHPTAQSQANKTHRSVMLIKKV